MKTKATVGSKLPATKQVPAAAAKPEPKQPVKKNSEESSTEQQPKQLKRQEVVLQELQRLKSREEKLSAAHGEDAEELELHPCEEFDDLLGTGSPCAPQERVTAASSAAVPDKKV